MRINYFEDLKIPEDLYSPLRGLGGKKRQAPHIAPLNHLLLLPSGPGRVQQELVV